MPQYDEDMLTFARSIRDYRVKEKDGNNTCYPSTTGLFTVVIASLLQDVAIYGDAKIQAKVRETVKTLMTENPRAII